MNCLIIDDEPLARKGIMEYAKEIQFLRIKGECGSAVKASELIAERSIDLLFLDIQMPKLTGTQFLRSLRQPPLTIITTAFPDHALEGFELDAVDYLVKPVSFDRFIKAVNKAKELFELRKRGTQLVTNDYFFVKANQKFEKVMFDDVLYCEAMQNYSVIHLANQKLITYLTFSSLEQQLPSDRFMKIHKSFIVSIRKVQSVEGNEIYIGNKAIPISRNLRDVVMKRIVENNLLKRK